MSKKDKDECLAREQGEHKVIKPRYIENDTCEEIKELEQALAKSEERVNLFEKKLERDNKISQAVIQDQQDLIGRMNDENDLLWKLIKIAR